MHPWFIPLAAIVTLAIVAGSILGWWWLPLLTALAAGYMLMRTRNRKS